MPLPALTPAEVLEERLSDKLLLRSVSPEKHHAVYDIARIAMKAIHSAAAAGNVQCRDALVELHPHIKTLLK